mmetsp:Transcript_1160/g.1618  ORF Transcript_1160/g.1618 Transcript_1160/m.1618 type:complete len:348 (-) Transcript_1160:421-1464(-)
MESLHALSKDLLAGAYERPSMESQTMPMPQATPARMRRARSRSVTFGDSVLRSDIEQVLKDHDVNEENEEDDTEDKNDIKSLTRASSAILSSLDTSVAKGIDGTPLQSPINSKKINRQSNVGLLSESYVGSTSSNLLISRSTDEKEEGEEYDSSLSVTVTGVRIGKDNTMLYRRVMVICALHDPNGKQKSIIQKTYALSGKSPFAYDDKASTFTKWDPLPVPGDYLIFYVLVDSKRICKTNLKLGRDVQIGTEFFRWFPLNYAHKNFPWQVMSSALFIRIDFVGLIIKSLQVDSQEAKGFLCIRINFETTASFAFRTDYQVFLPIKNQKSIDEIIWNTEWSCFAIRG